MQILKGHRKVVQSIAFSPDGKWLASGSGDRSIRVWDRATNEVRFQWEPHGVLGNQVRFSPDSRFVAAVHNHQVRVYDLKSGEEATVLGENVPAGFVRDLAFSPDGSMLAIGGAGGKVECWRIWQTKGWKELPKSALSAKNGYVARLAFTPDGKSLVVHGNSGLLLCDVKKWEVAATFPERESSSPADVLALSPDGRTVVYGSGSELSVCALDAKKEIAQLKLAKKHVQDAAFAPSGNILATVSNEETVKYWDTKSWKVRDEFAWEIGKLKCIAFTADGLCAAVGSDKGSILIWDLE